MANPIYRIPPHLGMSWGLDWPLLYGYISEIDSWAIWRRSDGLVLMLFQSQRNIHGYDFSEAKAKKASQPPSNPEEDALVNILHDMEA